MGKSFSLSVTRFRGGAGACLGAAAALTLVGVGICAHMMSEPTLDSLRGGSALRDSRKDSVCINRGITSGLEHVVYEAHRVLEIREHSSAAS